MADAIVSAVVERLATIIADQIRDEVNLVTGVEEKVQSLSEKLETLRDVLEDAERKGWKEPRFKKWLKKLEDVAFTMDDILDSWQHALRKHKFEKAAAKQKVSRFVPTPCLWLNQVVVSRDVAIRMQKVEARLDDLEKEKDFLNLVPSWVQAKSNPESEPRRGQTTSLIEVEEVVRGEDVDRNRNDIVERLCRSGDSNDHNQIVAIVGMGGIGKTTLAKLVYHDTRVKGCFELMFWICVSDPFDVDEIARGIVDSVGKETIPSNCSNRELKLGKLRDSIKGKRFLLVLDDVWTEERDDWAPLKISLKEGAPASKILVTTRNDGVARMMGTLEKDIFRPRVLNDEECWSLLRRISLPGRSDEECGKFEDVGKEIAKECKGLPLAASLLGSLLLSKNNLEEWEHVSKSEIWRLDDEKIDLFSHLLLSYNELPPRVKRCFSYCAIYPKDSQIRVETLLEEWMALGYLGPVREKHTGREYFNDLAIRYLFQDLHRRGGRRDEEVISCQMHDIVHDFAQSLRRHNEAAEMTKKSCQICDPVLVSQAREYRSLVWIKGSLVSICDCLKSLRVFRFRGHLPRGCPPPSGLKKLIHLRLLDLNSHELSDKDLKIICGLYLLQILVLSGCSIEEIPTEIGNLVDLRYLDLSLNYELRELPESMGRLHDLMHLDIQGCRKIHPLPEWFGKLENLQQLPSPDGILLCKFQVGSDLNKLGLLKDLNSLRGDLKLEIHLDSMSDLQAELAADARAAEIRNKIHIHTLCIQFYDPCWWRQSSSSSSSSSPSPSSPLWLKVIEALEPSHKLQRLTINGYKGSRLPDWMSLPLKTMKRVVLENMPELQSLPPMGKLPNLEVLHMEGMKALETAGREFLGIESSPTTSENMDAAFPKLKVLKFSKCPRWEEWEDITTEEEESPAISVMPCLTELYINSCPRLKMLPPRLLRKASSLQSLHITNPSTQQNIRGHNCSSPWRSISQCNPHLQLHLHWH